jgi:uracil-DNA glycosylase
MDIMMLAPSTDLTSWAEQGVLLLNTVLTVRKGMAASHRGMGWEALTLRAVQYMSQQPVPKVFILWGRDAQAFDPHIQAPHCVISSPHPSPFSAHTGFFGSKPFSRANSFLKANEIEPIDWLSLDKNHPSKKPLT